MLGDLLEGLIVFAFAMLPIAGAGVMYLLSEKVGFFARLLDWVLDMTKLNDDEEDFL